MEEYPDFMITAWIWSLLTKVFALIIRRSQFFHICLSQTSKITICINLKEFLDFWGIPKRKLKNIF